MEVVEINTIDEFDRLKATWDDIYRSDPNVTIQRSWQWMRGWIEGTTYNWLVLAVRKNQKTPFVAFLVLGFDVGKDTSVMIHMGGTPVAAHTGFACMPKYEKEAVSTIARYLQKKKEWIKLEAKDVLDQRLDSFANNFNKFKYRIVRKSPTICPYFNLPDTWDKYLEQYLGKETRRTLVKKFRRIERDLDYRETEANKENIDNHTEIIFEFWQRRWGQKPEILLDQIRSIYNSCMDNNSLYLAAMWDNATPIAAVAGYVDHEKKTFSCFMSGYDEKFDKYSPGNLIIAHSIKYAIQCGLSQYDLGRGEMEYKYSLGANQSENQNILIVRRHPKEILKNTLRRIRRKFLMLP